MFTITNEMLDRLKIMWETSISIDDYVSYSSAVFCAVSLFPLTVCYDIGYKLGSRCQCATPEELMEPEEPAPVLRRSARLAEKRLRNRLHRTSLD